MLWEETQPGFQTLLSSASFFESCSRSKLCFTLVVEIFEILTAWSSGSSHVLWNLRISVAYNSPHQCIARLFLKKKKRKKRNKCENSTFLPTLESTLVEIWMKKNGVITSCPPVTTTANHCPQFERLQFEQINSLVLCSNWYLKNRSQQSTASQSVS